LQPAERAPFVIRHSSFVIRRCGHAWIVARSGLSTLSLALLIWAGNALSLRAVTVAELQKHLAGGTNITIIDIRLPVVFQQGHIPGAINIPASVCAAKKLPPLGKVVVCGDGLGQSETAAVTALSAKPGITVEVLEGGYAAWESAQGQTTRPRGLHPETPHYISYAEVKALKPGEAVLVDLRQSPAKAAKAALQTTGSQASALAQPLTDLAAEFPRLAVSQSPFGTSSGRAGGTAPLLVLIDRGDGAAQDTERVLRANGIKRCVILTGGELILARHGRPGRQRSGTRLMPTNSITPTVVQPSH
jgi:rhodanese-related sulfurtransferase